MSHTATRLVLELVQQVRGDEGVAAVLAGAHEHRPLADLLDDAGWSSYAEFRRLLEAASAELGGDHALLDLGAQVDMTGGSMPSATEMIQAMGSPGVLFAELAKGHTGIVSFLEVGAVEVGPTEWVVENTYRPGFDPYPAFCAFMTGLHPMTPRLFGYEDVDVREETCVLRGDDKCRIRVRWAETDEAARRQATLEQRITLLERRLESFQTTVADLVLADDLDAALDRVVAAAARAVRAPGFVLAVELPGRDRRVHGHALPDDVAARIGADLLDGREVPEAGGLVVDIESSRHRYGKLAAYDPDGVVLADGAMLAAFARLAATALDSASALEQTRREAERARALLRLSAALAEIATSEEMAVNMVKALPAVIDADLYMIALQYDDVVRLVACEGYPPEVEAALLGTELPIPEDLVVTIQYLDRSAASPAVQQMFDLVGSVAAVVVPFVVDGEPVGWLTASVFDDPSRLAPDEELEARLLGLAAQASTALRNARLVEQIRHQAMHDALTGLPNRWLVLDRADQLLQRDRPVAALFLDLDGFKEINDTVGHAVGDQLLQAVAARLATTIREGDTLARLGGDEFVVLVDGGSGPELLAQRILEVLRRPFTLPGHDRPFHVTTSIGIASADDLATAGDLLRDADVALYQAKGAGKDRVSVFGSVSPN